MILLGFSTGKRSPVSAIIRKATGSRVSHAYIIFDDPLLQDRLIMEADTGGFQIQPYAKFKVHNNVIAEVPPKVQLEEGIRAAAQWLGEGYDYLGLFAGIWMMIGRHFRKLWNNPLHAPHEMFCSEAMVRLLQAAHYPGAENLIPWDTTPQDLLNFLS